MYYRNTANGDYLIDHTLTGWGDADVGSGESSLVTFDGRGCMKLDSGGSVGVDNYARRHMNHNDTFTNNTVLTYEWYHEYLGARGDNDFARILVYLISGLVVSVTWATDGLFVYDGASWNEVGTDIVKAGEWQRWTFDVHSTPGDLGNATCDVYLDGTLIESSVDCGHESGTSNAHFYVYQYGETTSHRTSYLHFIVAGSELIPLVLAGVSFENEKCDDLSGWSDDDTSNAESTQVTFDGKECFKFDSGISTGASVRARRSQDVGSFTNRVVASFSVYFDVLGLMTNNDDWRIEVWHTDIRCQIRGGSDGVFIYNGAVWVEVGTNIVVEGVWQEYTLDINFLTATVDVYLDGIIIERGMGCRWLANTNGMVVVYQQGYTTANRIFYMDWVRVGDDFNIGFVFSDPVPTDQGFTYLLNTPLQLTTTVEGYVYDISFYNTTVSDTLISTVSGVNSGEYAVSDTIYTPDTSVLYKWYVVATTSGDESISPEYSFNRSYRYYFSGEVQEEGTPVERVVRAYNRETGEFSNYTISSGGSYYLTVDSPTYSGTYDIVCLDNSVGESYNDLILGNMAPIFIEE